MNRQDVPELIVSMAPYMEELVHLRATVKRLRFEKSPPTPTVQELIAASPITIRQDDDGRYSASIDCGTATTGVSGCDTDVNCFQAAVRHVAALAGEKWADEDDE